MHIMQVVDSKPLRCYNFNVSDNVISLFIDWQNTKHIGRLQQTSKTTKVVSNVTTRLMILRTTAWHELTPVVLKNKPVLRRKEDADCKCSMCNFWLTAALHWTNQNELKIPRTGIIGDKYIHTRRIWHGPKMTKWRRFMSSQFNQCICRRRYYLFLIRSIHKL